MYRILTLLALVTAGLSGFSAAAQEPGSSPATLAVPTDATLSPGDSLIISVWRQEELSGSFQIAADGTVLHPVYRELSVTGIPIAAIEGRIRTLLSRFEANPQFAFEPLVRVAVAGEVKDPKIYYMNPGVTISQAVDWAGGITELARKDRVRLVRNGEETTMIVNDADSPALRMSIRSGDRVYVERRTNILRDYLGPVSSAVSALGTLYAFLNLVGIVGG